MTPFVKLSDEVFYTRNPFVKFGADEINFLKASVDKTQHKRIRLCAHLDIEDKLHEMIILILDETYIRPARHIDKAESLHVIHGEADAVFFDESGNITHVIPMAEPSSPGTFYYRMARPTYHTLLVNSPFFVFHECTKGPLIRAQTEFPSWAPDEDDMGAVKEYMQLLRGRTAQFLDRNSTVAESS